MTAVAVLAKAPMLGRVKTRLATEVGDERAVAIYRWAGHKVVRSLASAYPVTVWFDPPNAVEWMRAWLGERNFQPQPPGDLGRRMAHAVRWHAMRGETPVIVVGADVPDLGPPQVAAACEKLDGADVVLGPATDGGYYLVGVHRPQDALFTGIPWGGPRVMEVTLDACDAAHLRVRQLPPLRDLDSAADLAALGIYVP